MFEHICIISLSLSYSILMARVGQYQNVSILDFMGAKWW